MLKSAPVLLKQELKLNGKNLAVSLLIATLLFSVVLCILNIAFDLTDHLAEKFDKSNESGYAIYVKNPDFRYKHSKAYLMIDLSLYTYHARMAAENGNFIVCEKGGTSYQLDQAKDVQLLSGKEYTLDSDKQEVWLSSDIAQALNVSCSQSVSMLVYGKSVHFTVAGIFADLPFDFFMAPSLAQSLYGKVFPLTVFAVFESIRDYQGVFASLKSMNPIEDESILGWSRNIALVGVLLGAVAFLLFVTAMGVVYATIHMLLVQRTHFNGILRVLGARLHTVAMLYFGIFFVFISIAVLLGIGISAGFSVYLASLAEQLFEIELQSAVSLWAVAITYFTALAGAAAQTLLLLRKLKKQSITKLLGRHE